MSKIITFRGLTEELKNEIDKLRKVNGKVTVIYPDGTEVKRSIFYNDYGQVGLLERSNCRRGVCCREGLALEFPDEKEEKRWQDIVRHNASKVVKYLTASGYWKELLDACKEIAEASDEKLELIFKSDIDYRERNLSECIRNWYYTLVNLENEKRAVFTVNFGKYNDDIRRNVADAIKNHKDYSKRWRVNYDNSIEIKGDRAWYSEEYKDCGNGYYHFLLDEKHVLYGERD